MRAIQEVLQADAVVFHTVRGPTRDSGPRVDDVLAIGCPRVADLYLHSLGRSYEDMGVDLDSHPELDSWSLAQSSQIPERHLRDYWRPADIQSAIACFASCRGHVAGMYTAFRTTTAAFRDEDLTGAKRRLGGALTCLRENGERGTHGRRFLAVLNRNAEVVASSTPEWPRWLEAAPHTWRPRLVDKAGLFYAGAASVHVDPMKVRDGGALWAVTASRPPAQSVTRAMTWTRARRRVAVFAASGATVIEIAQAENRSPNTVKSHIQAIYRDTGAADRAELALFLAPQFSDPD
jgi:DNA-binding CsgD family transcriptional regulator